MFTHPAWAVFKFLAPWLLIASIGVLGWGGWKYVQVQTAYNKTLKEEVVETRNELQAVRDQQERILASIAKRDEAFKGIDKKLNGLKKGIDNVPKSECDLAPPNPDLVRMFQQQGIFENP